MRVKKLQNVSDENIDLRLVNGAEVTLPPSAIMQNVDVVEVESLKGKVDFIQDLTEVNLPSGKKRLLG
jgi:hypothetical protein